MEITEVRIKLTEDSDDRLQAFCSITFDNCFVVRDLKIIEGTNGPFVAMPSRKLTSHCARCGCKNHLRASYCNQCGSKLHTDRAPRDVDGRAKLYADIAHPINSTCREAIQEKVISAYRHELELAKQPGYVSRYDDDYEDDFATSDLGVEMAPPPTVATAPATGGIPPADVGSPPPEVVREKSPVPAPHLPTAGTPATPMAADRADSRHGPPAPHATRGRKPGFGAGILDE